jgi:hypothetical protein
VNTIVLQSLFICLLSFKTFFGLFVLLSLLPHVSRKPGDCGGTDAEEYGGCMIALCRLVPITQESQANRKIAAELVQKWAR